MERDGSIASLKRERKALRTQCARRRVRKRAEEAT